ncbi:MAG: SRPBCC family protein [Flavitalea sp.]
MNNPVIIVERLFDKTIDQVWKAITDNQEMKKWYFDLPEFRAEEGFKFEFYGGPSPEKQYLHQCEVVEVVPEKILVYTWKYDGYPGTSYVSFELFPQDSNTLLRLTHTGLETFASTNPDFAVSNFQEGWDAIVHENLRNYLDNN